MKVFVIEDNYGEETGENHISAGCECPDGRKTGSVPVLDTMVGCEFPNDGKFRSESGNAATFGSEFPGRFDAGSGSDPSGSGRNVDAIPSDTGGGLSLSNSKFCPGWYLIADSAVTNTGKPFYLPEDLGRVEVALSVAIRMNRLGKSIAERYASRYYAEAAPALHFRLADYREKLKKESRPLDASANFDRSLFVGDFRPVEEISELTLECNGKPALTWKWQGLKATSEVILSNISRLNTIKMGDLMLPGLSGWRALKEGDRMDVMVNSQKAFQVKVK